MTISGVNDNELVKALRKKGQDAFVELLSRYTEKVFNLAFRITRNQEDSEEITQDVFITVFNKIDRFEGKSAFSSWLYRITANTAFMKLRKRKQSTTLIVEDLTTPTSEGHVGTTIESTDINFISTRHELREVLERAIGKLPDEYRVIFVLRDVDGLSNQEVGEILSISVPAVKSRLHRARLMLRKRLQPFYNDYSDSEYIAYGARVFLEENLTH